MRYELFSQDVSQKDTQSKPMLKPKRLIRVDPVSQEVQVGKIDSLIDLLRPGDLLVVNQAGTLPASLHGFDPISGRSIEMRLASTLSPEAADLSKWNAVLFGEGDWRTPTEKRPNPPRVGIGAELVFGGGLRATIIKVLDSNPRWIEIEFVQKGAELWELLYRAGKPIQYSYRHESLQLWDQQTPFAGPPVAVEPPSAAFPLSWELLFRIRAKGVGIVPILHAAGISSTGNSELDSLLPFPERYWISSSAADAINLVRKAGGRVVAVGTSVVRALESAWDAKIGGINPGTAVTSLKITSEHRRHAVDGLLTGLHEPGSSHLQLLSSFIAPEVLERAYKKAAELGLDWHENGDSCLILRTDEVPSA